MTETDLQTLSAFQEFKVKRRRAPTMTELSELFGVARVSVHERLQRLVSQGLLENTRPGYAGSYRVTFAGRSALRRNKSCPSCGRDL